MNTKYAAQFFFIHTLSIHRRTIFYIIYIVNILCFTSHFGTNGHLTDIVS